MTQQASQDAEARLRAYVEYFRDLGVYDLYRRGEPDAEVAEALRARLEAANVGVVTCDAVAKSPRAVTQSIPGSVVVASPATISPVKPPVNRPISASPVNSVSAPSQAATREPTVSSPHLAPPSMPLRSFNQLSPLPEQRVAPEDKAAALLAIQQEIGDCTRCPLAYAGRNKIVFADGDPNAKLMFVGEGPGADEDKTGLPFVGKAGQLLNNMIGAMGLKREQVYIANIVKCRPPANRVPEPIEANTCSPFLLQQIDVVQPQVIVALGATAATYLLGVKRSLGSLRGHWHEVRGAKVVVTYHPAFLLRDPSQKGEAWKDLQRVMVELGLKPAAR